MSSNIPTDDEADDGDLSECRPISAMAPTVRMQEESQMEVTSSPAFQCLEEVQIVMCWLELDIIFAVAVSTTKFC